MESAKEKRISAELKKLNELYRDLPENKKKLMSALIQNVAFMKVTLEELQATINLEGATDEYCNGANQFGRKQSANIQAYNSLIKNYTNAIEKLDKMLPVETRKSKLESFIDE